MRGLIDLGENSRRGLTDLRGAGWFQVHPSSPYSRDPVEVSRAEMVGTRFSCWQPADYAATTNLDRERYVMVLSQQEFAHRTTAGHSASCHTTCGKSSVVCLTVLEGSSI
jgi:hypothetical protein